MPLRRLTFALRNLGRRSFAATAQTVPTLLPSEPLVDEERLPSFNARNYYPANPGEVIGDDYKLISKLGWGAGSTVWLAEVITCSTNPKEHVAIKLCNCDVTEDDRWSEAETNMHLATASTREHGLGALGVAHGAFEIMSHRGDTHLAVLFEALREPLWLFRKRITGEKSAFDFDDLPLLKTYIQILLEGLDYMHSECHVIHTDLKLDNIMLSFEHPSTIDAYVAGQIKNPMARKQRDDYTVYRCHNDFGPVVKGIGQMLPKITDFGLAQRGDKESVLIHPIQPNEYRAPEVLLGLGWSYSADIWNFALVIWEFLAGKSLFHQPNQTYDAAQHLADMISLLGNVPPHLVKREKEMRHWKWTPAVKNSSGKLCNNAASFYGGPFFDEEGKFLYNHLVTYKGTLESQVPEFIGEEAGLFLKFIRRMLRWTPECRATATELIDDPWLGPCKWRRTGSVA